MDRLRSSIPCMGNFAEGKGHFLYVMAILYILYMQHSIINTVGMMGVQPTTI